MDVLEFGEGRSEVSVRSSPGGPLVRILSSSAGGASSIPDWGTEVPLAVQGGQNEKALSKRINAVIAFHKEKAMAPHASTLAWKVPWTEEPGRLRSMGSRRVGHD